MIVDVLIEDPKGANGRHVVDPATGCWRCYRHPYARSPWPAAYGALPATRNAADGDPLDVLVFSGRALATGDRLEVLVIGLLPRRDGDHKLLAVDLTDPLRAGAREPADLPEADLASVETWFREWTYFDQPEGAEAARALIASCT